MNYSRWIKAAIIIVALLAPLLLKSVSTSIDETTLSVTLAEDEPLAILDDEASIEAFRKIGYNITTGFQNKLFNNFFKIVEAKDSQLFQYQIKEVQRFARLDSIAFGTRYYTSLFRMLLKSKANRDRWIKLWKFRWRFYNELRTKGMKDASEDKSLEEFLKKIKRFSLEKWCFMDYEIAADYYFSSQRDSTAFEYLKKAYNSTVQTEHYPICSHLSGRIGVYLAREGKFEEAMKYYEASLRFARIANDPYFISRALSFISFLKGSMGEFAAADSLMREALEYCSLTMDPVCEISKLVGLARLYNSFGETEKALYHLEEAICIATEKLKHSKVKENKYLYNSIKHYMAAALSLKGRINLKLGNLSDAITPIKESIEIYRNSLDRYAESQLVKTLADAYANSGDFKKAEKHYSEAIKIVTRLGKRRKLSEYLTSLAQLYFKEGKKDKCRETLEKAMDIASEEQYWMQKIDIDQQLSNLSVAEKDTVKAKIELERAIWLYSHELGKINNPGDRRALAEKVNMLFSELFDLLYAGESPCDSLLLWKMGQYALNHSHRPDISFTRIRKKSPSALSKRIDSRNLILQYIKGATNYYLIILSSEGMDCSYLPRGKNRIEGAVKKFLQIYEESIDPNNPVSNRKTEELTSASKNLGKMVLGGIHTLLPSKNKILVIPDGSLISVPFELLLLVMNDVQGSYSEGMSVSYLPSLSFADLSERREDNGEAFKKALVISNPHKAEWLTRRYPSLLPLKSADKEVRTISRYVDDTKILDGKMAKKDSLVKIIEEPGLIHFATHSIYYPEYEEKPSLMLASDDSTMDMRDVVFTPDEIKSAKIKTHLVVLATCESSSERNNDFKKELGLAEAFLIAGAQKVIAVRGPVEDRQAAAFFENYYKNLFEKGLTAEQAFFRTRDQMIKIDRENGYTWSVAKWCRFVLLTRKINY